MGRKRTVRTYKDTSAKGDRTAIEGNRFFIKVELVSLKCEKKADAIGLTSELYFKVGGKGLFKLDHRTPVNGTIHLDMNEVFKPTDGLTLFCDFVESEKGGTYEIPFKIYDQDVGKDDKLLSTELSVSSGQGTEFVAFQEKGIKVKVGISANRTRY